jgi:hypothetical protein
MITTASFVTPFVNRYDKRLFPLVRQLFFVPDQLSKLMYLKIQCFSSCLNHINTLRPQPQKH